MCQLTEDLPEKNARNSNSVIQQIESPMILLEVQFLLPTYRIGAVLAGVRKGKEENVSG